MCVPLDSGPDATCGQVPARGAVGCKGVDVYACVPLRELAFRRIVQRCTDEIGQVQPTREQVAQYWNVPFDRDYRMPGLDNSVMPWKIARDGSVTNGLA